MVLLSLLDGRSAEWFASRRQEDHIRSNGVAFRLLAAYRTVQAALIKPFWTVVVILICARAIILVVTVIRVAAGQPDRLPSDPYICLMARICLISWPARAPALFCMRERRLRILLGRTTAQFSKLICIFIFLDTWASLLVEVRAVEPLARFLHRKRHRCWFLVFCKVAVLAHFTCAHC